MITGGISAKVKEEKPVVDAASSNRAFSALPA